MNGDIISIKGTRSGLVALINTEYDFTEIKNILRTKIENSRGFFKGARITFHYPGDKCLTEEMTIELENICSEYGLLPRLPGPQRRNPEISFHRPITRWPCPWQIMSTL